MALSSARVRTASASDLDAAGRGPRRQQAEQSRQHQIGAGQDERRRRSVPGQRAASTRRRCGRTPAAPKRKPSATSASTARIAVRRALSRRRRPSASAAMRARRRARIDQRIVAAERRSRRRPRSGSPAAAARAPCRTPPRPVRAPRPPRRIPPTRRGRPHRRPPASPGPSSAPRPARAAGRSARCVPCPSHAVEFPLLQPPYRLAATDGKLGLCRRVPCTLARAARYSTGSATLISDWLGRSIVGDRAAAGRPPHRRAPPD